MTTTIVEKPKVMPVVDATSFDGQVSPFVARAKAATVTTVEEDESAKKEFQAGTVLRKFIEGVYETPKGVLNAAHKAMVAEEKKVLAPVLEGLRIYESKILSFKAEQDRKAAEEARRLANEARKAEDERRLSEAVHADNSGDKALAEEILAEPATPMAFSVAPQVAKVEGISTRKTWSAQVLDLKALIKFVAAKCDEDPGVLCYLEPATTVLNREAVNKKDLLRIPGVKAIAKEGISGRSAFKGS